MWVVFSCACSCVFGCHLLCAISLCVCYLPSVPMLFSLRPVLAQGKDMYLGSQNRQPKVIRAKSVAVTDLRAALATKWSTRPVSFLGSSGYVQAEAPITAAYSVLTGLATKALLLGAGAGAGSGSEASSSSSSSSSSDDEVKSGGLFLRESLDYQYSPQTAARWSKGFVCVTDLGVTVLAEAGGGHGLGKLVVWVTRLSTGAIVQGARVDLFRGTSRDYNGPSSVDDVVVAATAGTGSDGVAVVDLPPLTTPSGLGRYAYVNRYQTLAVTLGEEVALVDSLPTPPSLTSERLHGQLITDRKLYRLGEKVRVKAYIRVKRGNDGRASNIRVVAAAGGAAAQDGDDGNGSKGSDDGDVLVPVMTGPGQRLSLTASVQWSSSSSSPYPYQQQPDKGGAGAAATVSISPDQIHNDYGSFEFILDVPADASYGDHSVYLVRSDVVVAWWWWWWFWWQ